MKLRLDAIPRRDAILSILALALAATVVVGNDDRSKTVPASAEAPPPKSGPVGKASEATRVTAADDLDLASLHRAKREGTIPDVFGAKAWLPPAAASVVAPVVAKSAREPPPPPPAPPELPFRYVGKMVEDGNPKIFLASGDKDYTAVAGEVIEGIYRVEEVTESSVTFTYVPLDARQVLTIESPN